MSIALFNIMLIALEILVLVLMLGNISLLFVAINTIIKSKFDKKTKLGWIVLSVFTLNIAVAIYFIKSGRKSLSIITLLNLLLSVLALSILIKIGSDLAMH